MNLKLHLPDMWFVQHYSTLPVLFLFLFCFLLLPDFYLGYPDLHFLIVFLESPSLSTIIGADWFFGLPLGRVVFSAPSLGVCFLVGRPLLFEVSSASSFRLTDSLLSTIIGCADDDDAD